MSFVETKLQLFFQNI